MLTIIHRQLRTEGMDIIYYTFMIQEGKTYGRTIITIERDKNGARNGRNRLT